METEVAAKVDLGSLGSFDFTPDWAKKDAGVTVGKTRPERPSRVAGENAGGERRMDSPRGDRKPFAKRPFDRNKPKFAKPGTGVGRGIGGGFERPKPLTAEVKVLPETKALGTIIRKLQQDYHAYKLKELAYFFLDNPSSVLLRITPGADEKLHQCKACGFASTAEADVHAHILNAHLGDYYEAKEIECEPPKGTFNCVAKCGLSGVLLGPPNVHDFNSTVREMIREMAADKAIIISTHILEEVDAVCTRAIVIANGEIKADGTPAELRSKDSSGRLDVVFRNLTMKKEEA